MSKYLKNHLQAPSLSKINKMIGRRMTKNIKIFSPMNFEGKCLLKETSILLNFDEIFGTHQILLKYNN